MLTCCCADLAITGNEQPHQILSSVNISCSSDLAVQTIRWLNNSDNGWELFNNSGQQQLLLPIERVTSSLANTMYTCEVRVVLATGTSIVQKNLTFVVDGMCISSLCLVTTPVFEGCIRIIVHQKPKNPMYVWLLLHHNLNSICCEFKPPILQ